MTDGQRRYEILDVLGKGGFGTVYRARLHGSSGFTKDVALKVLNPEVAASEDVLRRLRDEARMLGLLRHRAIVHVDGLAHLDSRWAIIMELVDGASLREILSTGKLPPSVALEICEEVAAALDVAFARPTAEGPPLRLLHRDIKPSNIQITAQGEVKLLDFGVARADFGGREAETRSMIFGSLDYLAPERLDFEDTHGGDIYALGVTLYELLLGTSLGKTSVHPRKHKEHLERAQRSLRLSIQDTELESLILDCLDYETEARPDARTFARRARDLRRRWSEPWLRDWAEQAVPQAQQRRRTQRDTWSGSLVGEALASLGSDTLPISFDTHLDLDDEAEAEALSLRGSTPAPLVRFDEEPSIAAPSFADSGAWDESPRTPAPPDPPARPASAPAPVHQDVVIDASGVRPDVSRAPKRRRGGCLRWALISMLVVVVLGVTTAVALPTAFIALLQATGIWDAAWEETVVDSFVDLRAQVAACHPSMDQERVLGVIDEGRDPDNAAQIGLLEIVEIENAIKAAAADRDISTAEAGEIERIFSRITRR